MKAREIPKRDLHLIVDDYGIDIETLLKLKKFKVRIMHSPITRFIKDGPQCNCLHLSFTQALVKVVDEKVEYDYLYSVYSELCNRPNARNSFKINNVTVILRKASFIEVPIEVLDRKE